MIDARAQALAEFLAFDSAPIRGRLRVVEIREPHRLRGRLLDRVEVPPGAVDYVAIAEHVLALAAATGRRVYARGRFSRGNQNYDLDRPIEHTRRGVA